MLTLLFALFYYYSIEKISLILSHILIVSIAMMIAIQGTANIRSNMLF